MNLSPLQAIDRLQKIAVEFRESWIGDSPWLVLEDGHALPATVPVAKMLEEFEKHGAAVGICGFAILKQSARFAVLKMAFKKDTKALDRSFKNAQRILDETVKHLDLLGIKKYKE